MKRLALSSYEQTLEITKEIEDKQEEGNYLGNLGMAYYYLGELRKAIENFEQALKIAKELGYRQGEGAALGNLGLAYNALGEPKKAIECYDQAIKMAKESGDRRGEGNWLLAPWPPGWLLFKQILSFFLAKRKIPYPF